MNLCAHMTQNASLIPMNKPRGMTLTIRLAGKSGLPLANGRS